MENPFKVIEGIDPERMQISFSDGKANIYLIKTDEGLIIDVYDRTDEIIHTACIWDDDLDPWDDDLDPFE